MNEVYKGSARDRKYIEIYLKNLRSINPREIATLSGAVNLASQSIKTMIDMGQFWDFARRGVTEFQRRYGIKIKLLDRYRYYTAQPPEKTAIGGFHDERSLGYQYWYSAGFNVALNREMFSKEILTIEFVRGFLHDCLHHSTFRSFRRAWRIPASSKEIAKHRVPEIYREQYGINFRNKDGLSYSATELTAQSPEAINLNLLMDGVIVLVVGEAMREIVQIFPKSTTEMESTILGDVMLDNTSLTMWPNAGKFYSAITRPSKLFIEKWGGEELMRYLLHAMITGRLGELQVFFGKKKGSPDAWEKTFKRPGFTLTY